MSEAGTELARQVVTTADRSFMSRIGFVEVLAALGRRAQPRAIDRFRREWRFIDVVDVEQPIVERAGELALHAGLRSLDALHLASALTLPREELVLATWDRRLHFAAQAHGLEVLPESLEAG